MDQMHKCAETPILIQNSGLPTMWDVALRPPKSLYMLILNHLNRGVYSFCDGVLFIHYSVTEEGCKITLYFTWKF